MGVKSTVVAIRDFFAPWKRQEPKLRSLETICMDSSEAMAFETYAIQLAINRIANGIALSDFETYEEGKPVKGKNWWLFNYQPNANQNKADFWQEAIYQMVWGPDGALIVQSDDPDDGSMVVAEDFTLQEYAFLENTYSDIQLAGGLRLKTARSESQVFRLKLGNNQVKKIIDGIYQYYGKLIDGSIKNYNRGNAMKLILHVASSFDQFDKERDEEGKSEGDYILDELFEDRFKKFMGSTDSVIPLEEGLSLESVAAESGNTKSGAVTTRDIADVFDDILNMVADAFLIPRGLLKGDVADVADMTDNYINQCIVPLAEQIQSEFNRKLYGEDQVRKGTKLKVNPTTILTRDPVKFANAAEALFRSGVYSTNEIRKKLGEESIREPWADQHYVTKNYGIAEGEEDGSEAGKNATQEN